MLRFTCSLRTSSTRRIGREVVFLPWNARPWPAYDTHADDWKFLDRALSAVVEMTPEEVSERSLRLCPRHLLHEIEDPVEALQRRCRIEAQRSLRQQQQQQQQQQQRRKKQPQRQGEEQRAAQQLLEQERYMEEGLCHTTAPESERESQQTTIAQVHGKKKRSSKRNVNIHNSGGGSVNGNNNNNSGGGGGGSLASASASGRTETVTAGGEAALCSKRTSRANGKDGKRNSKSDASGRDEMQLPRRPLPDDNILNV